MDILMRQLSSRVAKKTGLSKTECDGLIKVVAYEILQGIIENGIVDIEGLGTLYRTHSDELGMLMLSPTPEGYARLAAPYKGERTNEIIFE